MEMNDSNRVNLVGALAAPRGAWGSDGRGASGNGHRPWQSANHTDWWRGDPSQWATICNVKGGGDGDLHVPPTTWGASGGRQGKQGERNGCALIQCYCGLKVPP